MNEALVKKLRLMPDMKALVLKPPSEHYLEEQSSLTAAKRRDFVKWITDAKREDTRMNRVAATIDKLERGLKSPFDK
jgi:uncharacterized protein YdeI (YjbR/CyaY-like superfamily)